MKVDIEIRELRKTYGEFDVIPKLSAAFKAGEFTVMLGPSGCGKSTLLTMLAGLEPVTSGRIFFGDREVQNVAAKDRGCAMVFQNYALYPHMSVSENIGYALKLAKVPKVERRERVARVGRNVGLQDVLDRRPSQLSGGQRQRVAIARAIIREPGVLLFDEPLSNLDAQLRHDMRRELSELHRRIGATSVFVTHDQVEAMTLADKILVLNKGRMEQFGAPQEIYHRPATTFVARFIGAPAMNLINVAGDAGFVKLTNGDVVRDHAHAGPALLGVRPEKVAPVLRGGLPARVIYREDLGSHRIIKVRLADGQELKIVTTVGGEVAERSEIGVEIRTEDIHLFDPTSHRRLAPTASSL